KANLFHKNLTEIASEYPSVISKIKGLGLMIGIKCKIENSILSNELYDNGILTVNAGDNVIRILPPLNISIPEITKVSQIIKKSVQNIDKKNAKK
ncbi:MAG: aminotransferase class III-fold pyridoxal phosphate-dependent enzyme, partial [Alphaproteobacteria bacterium]